MVGKLRVPNPPLAEKGANVKFSISHLFGCVSDFVIYVWHMAYNFRLVEKSESKGVG